MSTNVSPEPNVTTSTEQRQHPHEVQERLRRAELALQRHEQQKSS